MTPRTLADIELARIYFDILVGLAKSCKGQTIEYGQLLKSARENNPNNQFVKGALARSMGRRLDTLRAFTSSRNLPDLSALVVNKATGDNGAGFQRSFNGDAVRATIEAFDWASVQVDFDEYIAGEKLAYELREISQRKPKKISESEAREILWAFYKNHKVEMGGVTLQEKERMVKLIIEGQSPEEALAAVRNGNPELTNKQAS